MIKPKGPGGARKSPETKEALRLVMVEGWTAYKAAKHTGVARSTISQDKVYRAFIAEKKSKGD